MKVLLDECLPRDLRRHLAGHDCQTVPQAGLAGKANGELLALAERSGWQILLTMDRGMPYQQNLAGGTIAPRHYLCQVKPPARPAPSRPRDLSRPLQH